MSELLTKLLNPKDASLDIIFVGGCGEFGMNLTCYIYQGRVYMVDCGLAFAEEFELGVDAHIPQIDEVIAAFGGVHAYLITHGHEDHVGALPFFARKWPAPIYATSWTIEIMKDRFERAQLSISQFDVRKVRAGDQLQIGDCNFHWVHKPHSIPMCCSLWMQFGNHKIYHTGDFKMDPKPLYENGPDWNLIDQAGKDGIDILIADSTNAGKNGFCPSESQVVDPLEKLITESKQLVVFSGFSSNFWRLKTLSEIAQKVGRKILPTGSGINKCFDIATELGLYHPEPGLFIQPEELSHYPRSKVIVLASGSQFENRSALRRIIQGEHGQISLKAGDRLILSSRIIPGNEKGVFTMMSLCAQQGVEVLSSYSHPDIHVSGHAYQDDLVQLAGALKPRFYVPVHGTFTQLLANSQLIQNSAKSVNVGNGTVLRLSQGELSTLGEFDFDRLFIDSWSRRPMDYETLRSRLKIGDSGLLLLSGAIDPRLGSNSDQVQMDSIGLPFSDQLEFDQWRNQALVKIDGLIKKQTKGPDQEAELNEAIRRELRRDLTRMFIKKPVVISRIHLVPKGPSL